jgi:hypothetical protein
MPSVARSRVCQLIGDSSSSTAGGALAGAAGPALEIAPGAPGGMAGTGLVLGAAAGAQAAANPSSSSANGRWRNVDVVMSA